MNIVAKRLVQAIRNKGLTQRELAKRSGVSEGNISHYARGDWMPKRDKVYKLATALDVSPAWLLGLDFDQQSINDIYDQLNDDNKEQARKYMIFLLSTQAQEERDV